MRTIDDSIINIDFSVEHDCYEVLFSDNTTVEVYEDGSVIGGTTEQQNKALAAVNL